MVTWECALNYTGTYALAKAIAAAGTVTDIRKIRAAFSEAAFPLLADKFPNEAFGLTNTGRMLILASVQTITKGKSDKPELYAWWPKNQNEFDQVRKTSKTDRSVPFKLMRPEK